MTPYLPASLLDQALSLARDIDEAGMRVEALIAICHVSPEWKKGALFEEALRDARSINDPGPRADALVELATELGYSQSTDLLHEALEAARSVEDLGDRANSLATLAGMVPGSNESIVGEFLNAAADTSDVGEWIERLVDFSESVRDSSENVQLAEAVEAATDMAQQIDDPEGRAKSLVALAKALPDPRRSEALETALDAAREIEQSDASAGIARSVADVLADPEATPAVRRRIILEQAIEIGRRLQNASQRAGVLVSLSRAMPEPERGALLNEALMFVETSTTEAERARLLTSLAVDMPEPYREAALRDALSTARRISEAAPRVSALTRAALELEESEQYEILREAFTYRGAADALRSVELDEVEFIETIAALIPHLSERQREAVLAEAVTVANSIDRPYDHAHALVVLVPHLSGEQQEKLRGRALAAAGSITTETERAEVMTALVPYVSVAEKEALFAEALRITRHIDVEQIVVTGNVNVETGVVEVDLAAPFGGARARLLSKLASYVEGSRQEGLLEEALGSIYETPRPTEQAEALVELASCLPAKSVIKVLADLRSIDRDSTRTHAIAMVLSVLAERHGGESALREARTMFSHTPPADVLMVLAPFLEEPFKSHVLRQAQSGVGAIKDHGIRAETLALLGKALPEPSRSSMIADALEAARLIEDPTERGDIDSLLIEYFPGEPAIASLEDARDVEPMEEHRDEAGGRDDPGRVGFTVSGSGPDVFERMYRLSPSPHEALGRVTFEPPPPWPRGAASPAYLEKVVLQQVLTDAVHSLSDSQLQDALDAARAFKLDPQWIRAKTALLLRLADLGGIEWALDEVAEAWPEGPPPEVLASLAVHTSGTRRSPNLKKTLSAVRNIDSEQVRAAALVALAPHLSEPDRAEVRLEIAAAAERILESVPTTDGDSKVSKEALAIVERCLAVIPAASLVPLWQKTLRLASGWIRRDLLRSLPPLLPIIEPVAGDDIWDEMAAAVLEVRRWWP